MHSHGVKVTAALIGSKSWGCLLDHSPKCNTSRHSADKHFFLPLFFQNVERIFYIYSKFMFTFSIQLLCRVEHGLKSAWRTVDIFIFFTFAISNKAVFKSFKCCVTLSENSPCHFHACRFFSLCSLGESIHRLYKSY